jgi:thiamine biosynthesis lipoprotein
VPTDEAISGAMKHVDWRRLEARTEPPALRKLDPGIAINVSAMADGFACDDVAKLLRARGIKDFLVEIGGAVFGSGVNAPNQPWRAGIQRPHAETGESVKVVALHNQALSTSGMYRQYFESDGKRYAHVLDARTGRPIAHDVVSVSVIHESAFAADGWDTALLILGPEAGRALAKQHGIEALILAESH